MDNFNTTVNALLADDFKSAAAAGLIGLGALTGATPSQAEPSAITQPAQQGISMPALLKALEKVESNGKADAIGDNGNAKGILQIWDVVIQDVNRIYKTSYKHDDAFNPDKSRDIANKYLDYWGKHYQKKTGRTPTYEVLSRIWNGGPYGYKKDSTLKYWEKVKKELR